MDRKIQLTHPVLCLRVTEAVGVVGGGSGEVELWVIVVSPRHQHRPSTTITTLVTPHLHTLVDTCTNTNPRNTHHVLISMVNVM